MELATHICLVLHQVANSETGKGMDLLLRVVFRRNLDLQG